ncbi:MAG: hypothetical protein ACRCZF_24625, partial [Gemmataceae bacterium]
MVTSRRIAALLLTSAIGLNLSAAAPEPTPVSQRDQQKKVLAEVEQTARRIGTTLRVLSYQKLDGNTEQKMLDEVASTLRGLSQEQIKAVLTHLESATKAPNEETASAEQKQAYKKHREVVSSLKGLLTKLDVIKSLDIAAARLDKLGKDQLNSHLRAIQTDSLRAKPRRGSDDREEQADAQGDLRNEMTTIVKQLALLKSSLNPEQKTRLETADPFTKGAHIIADMELSGQALSGANYRDAADRQLRTSRDLQTLAAALRTPRDKMTALKEARDRIEKTIQAQEALKTESKEKPATPEQLQP